MMNKLGFGIILLAALLSLPGCNTDRGNLHLKATIPGLEYQMAYLMVTDSTGKRAADSALVGETGHLNLHASIDRLDFYQLEVGSGNAPFVFIAEPGDSLRIVFQQFPQTPERITGNPKTEAFYSFNKRVQTLTARRDSLMRAARSNPVVAQAAMQQLQQWQQNAQEEAIAFVKEHSHSPASLSALRLINPVENLALFESTLADLSQPMKGSVYLTNLENRIAQAKAEKAKQDAREAERKKQEAMLGQGQPAPDIALPNPNGTVRKLSDLRGKVVLIDFWASWCKPCRRENPNVVRMYNKYKNRGFEIYGVSLDRNKTAWVNAIRQDNLGWIHVSDLKFWNSAAAQLYRVRSIPFTVLVDENGKIIAKNLRGQALEQKLEEIFS